MCMPRDPDVFGQPTSPKSLRTSRVTHVTNLRPRNAGHRIEVHPQLVRMIQVAGADGVRIEVDASEVDDPGQLRGVAHHDLFGGPAGRKGELNGLDPLGPRCRRALLKEGLPFGPVDEALEG